MFTGLVDHCGTLTHIETTAAGKRLHIACAFEDLARGESIAIDGVCLTVTEHTLGNFICDVSPETLECTRFKLAKVGDRVNLERALRLSDRLGGHFVLGHVDQTCTLKNIVPTGEYVAYRFEGISDEERKYCVRKGSICINGVSLTLNAVNGESFEVMLIPETLQKTNLKDLQVGDLVNVEFDYLAKLVANP